MVIEGFSGTGKTSQAKMLEEAGWIRIPESAHMVPPEVSLADRADTFCDYALVGSVLSQIPKIVRSSAKARVVAEGYLISDITYAKIRYALGLSSAYPSLFSLVRELLKDPGLTPDLYVLLKTDEETIASRQLAKPERDQNLDRFFLTKYYEFIRQLHAELEQPRYVEVETNSRLDVTHQQIVGLLGERNLLTA